MKRMLLLAVAAALVASVEAKAVTLNVDAPAINDPAGLPNIHSVDYVGTAGAPD